MAVCIDGKDKLWYQPGDTIHLQRLQTLQVMDIQGNFYPDEPLTVHSSQPAFDLNGSWREQIVHLADLPALASNLPSSFAWTIKRRNQVLGELNVQVLP